MPEEALDFFRDTVSKTFAFVKPRLDVGMLENHEVLIIRILAFLVETVKESAHFLGKTAGPYPVQVEKSPYPLMSCGRPFLDHQQGGDEMETGVIDATYGFVKGALVKRGFVNSQCFPASLNPIRYIIL
jgi:hypothetical protein